MPPRARSRSRSRSVNPEADKVKTPRSRRSSVAAKASTPSKPKRKEALPVLLQNEQLMGGSTKAGPLKLQQLALDGDVQIAICRVKLPTPKGVSGHLIRRLDTDAVSASSLFRVAFPTASNEAEQAEMEYLAEHYDTVAAGHPAETHRLTGTWIPTADAPALAAEYNLTPFLGELLAFTPGSETPLKIGQSVSVPSSAQTADASTPVRSSKRQRVKSNEIKPSVTVSQTIASDPATGEIAETTQVTVEGDGLIGSDATVEKAVADAKALVETLKKEGTLPSVDGEVNSKKRSAAEIEDALVPATHSSFFGKVIHPTPNGRRLLALGGVLVTGAAAVAAPYIFS